MIDFLANIQQSNFHRICNDCLIYKEYATKVNNIEDEDEGDELFRDEVGDGTITKKREGRYTCRGVFARNHGVKTCLDTIVSPGMGE
jgi:hypothetical protein